MIAVLDYDIGNVGSVVNMLSRLGVHSELVSDPRNLDRASRVILPGNGSFDACMRRLKASGLAGALEHAVMRDAKPVLGICVGAQMMGVGSEEGSESGLGWLDMQVRRFPTRADLPVPHMGWQGVHVADDTHWLSRCLEEDSRFYFIHSYYMDPNDKALVTATAEYGLEFAAAVSVGCITGVQFHPEKSHRFGKAVLSAFAGDAL